MRSAAADSTLPGVGGGASKDSPPPVVTQIVITSGWVGLGRIPEPGKLVIKSTPKGYVASIGGKPAEQPVSKKLVDELVLATRDSVPQLELDKIHLTDSRRKELLPSLLAELVAPEPARTAEERRKRFADAWLDRAQVERAARDYYRTPRRWTDDYPRVAVEITEAGGRVTKLESGAQQPLMIPWKVTVSGGGDRAAQLWSGRFSRALSALMPDGFTERTRVSGEHVAREVAEHLVWMLDRK